VCTLKTNGYLPVSVYIHRLRFVSPFVTTDTDFLRYLHQKMSVGLLAMRTHAQITHMSLYIPSSQRLILLTAHERKSSCQITKLGLLLLCLSFHFETNNSCHVRFYPSTKVTILRNPRGNEFERYLTRRKCPSGLLLEGHFHFLWTSKLIIKRILKGQSTDTHLHCLCVLSFL